MRQSIFLGGLLVRSALVAPAALAQTPAPQPPAARPPRLSRSLRAPAEPPEQEIEVSVPGASPAPDADVVVTGTRTPNIVRVTPQVISVLSARTSPAPARRHRRRAAARHRPFGGRQRLRLRPRPRRPLFARAAQRLAAAEPRAAAPGRPLDIFPTSVIASSLVQKSYSVNYPGEFGGGVINLTTPPCRAILPQLRRRHRRRRRDDLQPRLHLLRQRHRRVRLRRRRPPLPGGAARRGRGRHVQPDDGGERRDFATSLTNAADHRASAQQQYSGQFLRRAQRRHSFDDRRRPDRRDRRVRLHAIPGGRATRCSRFRSIRGWVDRR